MDANGQINFAGADMAGSSYMPGEAVFLPAGTTEAGAAFNQPDLPPAAANSASNQSQSSSSKSPKMVDRANANLALAAAKFAKSQAAAAAKNPKKLPEENAAGEIIIPAVQPVDPAAVMQPLLEAYDYSASVDLDSETDSNHDTALTLACAGGHEELVQLLINRGANIGNF